MLPLSVASAPRRPPPHPRRRRPHPAVAVATVVAVTLLLAVAVDWAAARGAGVGGTGTGRRRGPAGALSSYLAHSAGAATAALRSAAGLDPPPLAEWVGKHCAHLARDHAPLVAAALAPWTAPANGTAPSLTVADVVASTESRQHEAALYVKGGSLFLGPRAWPHNLTPRYVATLARLGRRARLPDVVLPLNPGDEPQVRWGGGGGDPRPRPLFSFCLRPGHADVPFPNQFDGSVDAPNRETDMAVAGRPVGGRGDPRPATAFFRMTPGSLGGLPKGRGALLALSIRRPDLIDAGIDAWTPAAAAAFARRNETREGRLKPHASPRALAARHRYTVWAPGNCGSVRLAHQLASDCLVFKLASTETEWYFPLLAPWTHYVPVAGGDGAGDEAAPDGLPARIAWARAHDEAVAAIVRRAKRFAARSLSDGAVDCYVGRLLLAWRGVVAGGVDVPAGARPV